MPSSVNDVFAAARLKPAGCTRWGDPVPVKSPGVYAVSLSDDPATTAAARMRCPIDSERIEHLLSVRPEILLDGSPPENGAAITHRLSGFWLPDEVIVYIGLAGTSLRNRVRQYKTSKLGANKPHAGGWWIKTLSILDELFVHYAPTDDPTTAEIAMLDRFGTAMSAETRQRLPDRQVVLPFANLEIPTGLRKSHGFRNATGPL